MKRCLQILVLTFIVLYAGVLLARAQVMPAIASLQLDEISRHKPDSAYILLKELLVQYKTRGDTEGQALVYQKMGQVLFRMGSYPQAVTQLIEANRIFNTLNKPELIAANANLLGTVYYYNKQNAEALKEFKRAREIYAGIKDPFGLSETYAHIGQWHEKNQRLDSALFYQRSALEKALTSGNQVVIAKIFENIGSIYEDMPLYDSAKYYFQLSLQQYRSLGLRQEQVEVINNLGDIYSKTGNFTLGLQFAREAMDLAWAEQDKYQLQSAFRDIGECFEAIGRMDSAYLYLEKSRQLVQEIYTSDNQKQIALMQALYDFDQKNAQINQLNTTRKVYNIVIIAIVLVILLLGLLAATVYSRQKLKIQTQKNLSEQNHRIYLAEKELMASELRMKQLEEENLKQQLDTRSRELSSHILHLIQKNEVMEEIRVGLNEIIKDDRRDQKKQLRQILNKINFSFAQDDYWNEFRLIFDKVHSSFFDSIKQHCPELSPADIRLLALVKMDLNSVDMAKLLNVTPESLRVMRYRLKKKLQLDSMDSLQNFVSKIS